MKGIKIISKQYTNVYVGKVSVSITDIEKNIVFLLIQMLTKNILTRSTDNKFRDLKWKLKFRKTVMASYVVKSVFTGTTNNLYMKK